ncbi:PREDICTED: NACHT, LRR and PYD domains-containing protein 4C-like [Amphimedon queenslandica]|uniref:NACHT domain-containing protein n=1 Tax=Amphimedon queenslandica TaxID=400682 RepID=A0AAN0JJ76_AMPQE|nr:PREDICTED: NACHT, LRR and PYD domains-containing protein 4C-like [Amphimedon queenslandica]|eukprot:XP_019856733.1 PREDICTED: NACHT, LRR and PYD domains-containing protein 4C-like [Amphimedon queenslandica]
MSSKSSKSQVRKKQQSQKKSDVAELPTAKGPHKPHYPSWLFAHFYDELVSILIKDCDLLLHLTNSVTINLLKHPVDMEKIQRNSISIIGCKMLANAILEYLSKARRPDYAICDLLLILEGEGNVELTSLVNKIREQAEKNSYNIQPKCNVQIFLSLVHVSQSSKCIENFRSSFQLPLDPKCSLMVALEFIPLDKVSLKGVSPIGQTSPLSINELCDVPPSSWILIEGISGIGKSTLAYEMLKQWKDGTALQKYSYVLLLRLRNENVHQYWSSSPNVVRLIEDCLNEQYNEPPDILSNSGQNLLLILEGYDELPKKKLKCNAQVFYQLNRNFHNAVVIITTRPSFSYQLSNKILFTKKIEIIGFNKSNQDQYIKVAFKNDKAKHDEFKESIKSCPIIAQHLSVPLHLAIMIKIFSSSTQKPLPQTITELYESFAMILICKNSPQNEESIFQKCCEIAYEGLLEQQIVFDCDELNTLGLMQRESKIPGKEGGIRAVSFLHFKMQEFLAAYHMQAEFLLKEQKKLFEKYNSHQQLFPTMHFFSGLTKLQKGLCKIIELTGAYTFPLDQFYHLMEIKNNALVSEMLNENEMIDVSCVSRAITVQDFYILGRCFGLSSCSWKFGFTIRGLTSEHIKMFVSGFTDVLPHMQSQQSPNLERIVLSLNPIGNEGLAIFLSLPPSVLGTITEFFLRAASLKSNDCFKDCVTKFEHFHALKTFLFHDNEFKEGEQQQLIDVLCHGKLKNLKKVSFSSLSPRECSTLLSKSHLTQLELYELSHESVKELFTSLKTKCSKLISIELYQSPITKAIVERSLQDSLPDCILKELKLINCEIDSKTANLIINAATHSPTLQVIDLSDNIIDNEGGHYIASKLEELLVSRPRPSPRLQLAGETRELHNSAENILQLFLQHNFFTKKSIEEFTDKLTQLPYSFTIHLSLQWKDYVETKLSLSPQVEKLLVIDVQNDNLALKRKQQHHSTQPSIASLTCNDIPARHDERPDLVPSATDDTDEDDTESGWNKVKKKRRGRRHK